MGWLVWRWQEFLGILECHSAGTNSSILVLDFRVFFLFMVDTPPPGSHLSLFLAVWANAIRNSGSESDGGDEH